jgi:glucose-1-phosphate thymidylyltransferase
MKGVILAGGNGTRLRPLTYVANKHLLPVYDKPMIYYPIQTLKDMGCDQIVIISGGENIGGFAELLKDGTDLGVKITYRVQNSAAGVAGALGCAEGLVDGLFPVILGDNYFSQAPHMPSKPMLYVSEVEDPQRYGVYNANDDCLIVEKPALPEGSVGYAVTGLYVYDETVFDYLHELKPSARGELEITDVNNWYLKNNKDLIPTRYNYYWSDMGTFESLLDTAIHVAQ